MGETRHSIYTQRFGVELELVGVTRRKAAEAVQSVIGGDVRWIKRPLCFDPYSVTGDDGRSWRIQSDGSLKEVSFQYRIELISPILTWDNMATLQPIIRALRKAGCYPVPSCSVHCHVDVSPHTPKSIRNLVKTYNRLEHLIYMAVGVQEYRLAKYCRPNEEDFVKRLLHIRRVTNRSLNRAWYGSYKSQPARYDSTRYQALNLNSVWSGNGTIEFRFGEVYPKIHAGKIKAFIALCLGLSSYALNVTGTTARRKSFSDNPKYAFRVALNSLGLVGPEHRNTRMHLLSNLSGNSAWKDPDKIKAEKGDVL